MASWELGIPSQSGTISTVVSAWEITSFHAGAIVQVWVCTEWKGEVCFASKAIPAYRYCHLEVKASRIHCPKLCCFDMFIILSCGLLKNSRCRERLFSEFPYLPKDRTSKRNSMVADHLQEFHQRGKRDLSLKTRIDIILHTSSQTIAPPAHSSKGPVIFLKVIYLSLNRPASSSPFPAKMAVKPEF